MHSDDIHFMRHALSLARRGLGRVWPNPAVGCVIVNKDIVVGTGWTQDGGRPHAETVALAQAGRQAKGGTAYVTLEPCAHHGKTPPCAEALIAAGIKRVVAACGDPDPRVAGVGLQKLRDAGMAVLEGVLEQEAKSLNTGFFLRLQENRPFITLKMGVSQDGMIAAAPRQKTIVTGPLSHAHAHLERSMHDAILIGAGTVRADDPLLTARVPGYTHRIMRFVLDTHLTLPLSSRLAQTAEGDVCVYYAEDRHNNRAALEAAGIRCVQIHPHDLRAVMADLAHQGITRLLAEGGSAVYQSFLKAGLVDRVLRYEAPHMLGQGGLLALPPGFWEEQMQKWQLQGVEKRVLGKDLLEIYGR